MTFPSDFTNHLTKEEQISWKNKRKMLRETSHVIIGEISKLVDEARNGKIAYRPYIESAIEDLRWDLDMMKEDLWIVSDEQRSNIEITEMANQRKENES